MLDSKISLAGVEIGMGSVSAKCGHVKRRLNQGEPLTKKTLEFALSVIDEYNGFSDRKILYDIAYNLNP
jgi:hypothetical protein